LNFEYFIAKRISNQKLQKKEFSGTISGIVIIGISLSIAVMLIALAIVTGFKNEIRDKTIGFGSHVQILNYDSNLSYETEPIPSGLPVYEEIRSLEGVDHLQSFAIKAGIVKTETDIEGLVLKGINVDFDWKFFQSSLIEGRIFEVNDSIYSNDIVISSYLAKRLKINLGDPVRMWFVDERPRFRKFTLAGIYETSLAELDETFALVDIKHIQRLNGWTTEQVSGYEVQLDNFRRLEDVTWNVRDIIAGLYFEDGSRLKAENIREKYPQIFDWLELQDMNVFIIIALMLTVAGFNMVSGLLILILDRTYMIGVLKALGGKNLTIRKIFLYQSFNLIIKGLIIGNLLGISLSLLQKKFEIISLNPENYYLTTVPINLDLVNILTVNIGASLIIMLFLIFPSMLVSRISPSRVISFK
jgi:lipoprotein-releasing system permease protein